MNLVLERRVRLSLSAMLQAVKTTQMQQNFTVRKKEELLEETKKTASDFLSEVDELPKNKEDDHI